MINVNDNHSHYIVIDLAEKEYFYIGNREQDLIDFLAKAYNKSILFNEDETLSYGYYNRYFQNCTCNPRFTDLTPFDKRYLFKDTVDNKIINIKQYENLCKYIYEQRSSSVYSRKKWVKDKKYIGEFRREPVEGIHKSKNRFWRNKRVKHIIRDHLDPEMKPYKRGNKIHSYDFSGEYFEHVEKNWKRQSKRRHQWKPKDK